MTALVVALFLLFGYVEVRHALQDVARDEIERAGGSASSDGASETAAAERARRAYAIRCSCDGRDQ